MTTFEKECFDLCKNLEELFGGEWTYQVDYFRGELRFYRKVDGVVRYWAFDPNKVLHPEQDIPWQRAVVFTLNVEFAKEGLDFAHVQVNDGPKVERRRATEEDFK